MKQKTFKKILFEILLFVIIISFSCVTLAATNGVTTLELVENNVCTISLEDYAKFEKKLTNFNEDDKSATLTLTFTNLKESETVDTPIDVFLVIDNSRSMENSIGSKTREEAVIDSANALVNKIFAANPDNKVGVVSFSSVDGVEGTIDDAKLLQTLTNSKTAVQSAIEQVEENKGYRTNIEAGLETARLNFLSTGDSQRYIILLTDGVPNNDIHGTFSQYDDPVSANTIAKLQEIENSGIKIIGAMIGLDGNTIASLTTKTYRQLAEEIFGTVDDPSITSYYYIQDNDIEDTIVNQIYSDIIVTVNHSLKDIIIKDYFPQEIIDNFNFEYVASPNIGNVSTSVDTSDNSITWNISLLKEKETATLSYKLTLKDDYNKEIIDQILPTNTDVEIAAVYDNVLLTGISDDSPKVRVRYKEDAEPIVNNVVENNPIDNTVSPTKIPQAGDDTIAFISIISVISITALVRFIYLKNNKDIK